MAHTQLAREAREALDALLGYATELRGVSQQAAGVAWGQSTDEIRKLADESVWGAKRTSLEQLTWASETERTLLRAEDLFLDEKWLDRLSARMTETFVKTMRGRKRRLGESLAALRANLTRQVTNQVVTEVGSAPGEITKFAHKALAALRTNFNRLTLDVLLVLLPRLERSRERDGLFSLARDAILSVPLETPSVPEDTHPLLKMGLTFGISPRGTNCPAGKVGRDARLFEAGLPGAQPVVYDLDVLLAGVPGSAVSGLNYRLVQSLQTIRPLSSDARPESSGDARPERSGIWRIDTRPERSAEQTVARELNHRWSLPEMLNGPEPALATYNNLAEVALVDPSVGARIGQVAALLERFEEMGTPEAEAPRQGREIALLQRELGRVAADDVAASAKEFPTQAAESLGAFRLHEAQLWLDKQLTPNVLPGALEARQGELALTTVLQANRAERALTKAQRKAAKGALGSTFGRVLESESLSAASLKMTAAARARPRQNASPF